MKARDFTINSIAYPLTEETLQSPSLLSHLLIDPCEGKKDLERKLIRTFKGENLQADPLRVLRAFRFATQLNFSIADIDGLKRGMPYLSQVAPERIKHELSLFFSCRITDSLPQTEEAGLWEGLLESWGIEVDK